ncbi:MAG: T9SS type A sorting domain-containing protein [Flavipsychrobacter sp.]|nr:T9SS type A sorting domain-containing protein [Flavipsychrobacter sp.]
MFTIKPLLLVSMLALLPAYVAAQIYYPVTAPSGTQVVSGYHVTVTTSGSPSTVVPSANCGTGPYFIGVGGVTSGYIYTFSNPVTSARVQVYGLNDNEVISFKVNGNNFPVSGGPPAVNLTPYSGTCFAPYAVNFVNGNLTSSGNPVGSNPGSGVQVTINQSSGFTSFEVDYSNTTANATFGDGLTYNMFFSGICTSSTYITSNATHNAICSGKSLMLSGGTVPGATYNWSGPGGYTSSNQNPTISNIQATQAGLYTISAVVGTCTYTDTSTIYVNPSPPVPVATSNAPICSGSTLNLNIATIPNVTYGWQTPNHTISNQQSLTITSATSVDSGNFIASDTSVNGCVSLDTLAVAVSQALPPPGIIVTSTYGDTICTGGIITLVANTTNASVGSTFQWEKFHAAITGQTGSSYTSSSVADNDQYSCVVTSNLGACQVQKTSESAPITIRVQNTLPPPTITITPYPTVYVTGDTVTFTAHVANGGVGLTFQWMKNGSQVPGATTSSWQTNNVALGDKVWVVVTSGFPCAAPRTGSSNVIGVAVPTLNGTTDNIRLYPNPSNGSFTISGTLDMVTEATVEVIDVTGRVIYKEKLPVNNNELYQQLNLNAGPGNYILKIQSRESNYTLPFTIAK